MKKILITTGCFLVLFFGTSSVFPDNGGIRIRHQPPQTQPVPPQDNPPMPPQDGDVEDDRFALVPRDDEARDVIPPGEDDESLDGVLGVFKEPQQQALIVWNGKEEVLYLTVNSQAVGGTRPMFSIMPLPGKPISIEKSDKAVIDRAHKIVRKKIRLAERRDLSAVGNELVFKTEIGVHKIFVLRVASTATLENDLNYHLAQNYGKDYSVELDDHAKKILDQYLKNKFQYFVFDVRIADGKEIQTKTTIAYRFQSDFLYYPIAISQIGGVGKTEIRLTAIYNRPLTKAATDRGGMSAVEIAKGRVGEQAVAEVTLTQAELKEISSALPVFLGTGEKIRARQFYFYGNIDGKETRTRTGVVTQGLTKDFMMY